MEDNFGYFILYARAIPLDYSNRNKLTCNLYRMISYYKR